MWTSSGARPADRIAVIGLGNPLMGDDGLGLEVLARLHDEWTFAPDVVLVDGGTWGLQLLPIIESADRVVLIDAIRANREAGTVVVLEGDEVPRGLATKLSPHQTDMREILALAQFRGTLPEHLVAIGVEPDSVELRQGLSDVVAARLDVLCVLVVDRLMDWGAECTPRTLELVSCTR